MMFLPDSRGSSRQATGESFLIAFISIEPLAMKLYILT